jgi:hypothetical protein
MEENKNIEERPEHQGIKQKDESFERYYMSLISGTVYSSAV